MVNRGDNIHRGNIVGEKIKAELEVFPIAVACMRCYKRIGELFYDNAAIGRLVEYKVLCNSCYEDLLISYRKNNNNNNQNDR